MANPSPTTKQPPQAWLDAIAEAEADIQAGRTVDSTTVMHRLVQAIAELKAEITGAAS